jgi:anti-sigma regulatory factor (Ser/Thr protein kinase)
VGGIAKNAGFSDIEIEKIELAIDEACSNVLQHAYKFESNNRLAYDPGQDVYLAVSDDKGEHGPPRFFTLAVDLAALVGDGEMTPAQQAAVEKFKAARKEYDDFVAQSSAQVAQMDKLRGAQREALQNTLRARKKQEQPLRLNLTAAYKALTGAFPKAGGKQ